LYFLEGDELLTFVAIDKIMYFFMFIENSHWGNIDAVMVLWKTKKMPQEKDST
jgi:hypothetical protein